jgi:gamma-glutamyl-gamma-aminobutyrate hydrolase PuuD
MAISDGKPCIGICRGAQFLWAMSGGKLCQHIQPPHPQMHDVFGLQFEVNSFHHQGCVGKKPDGLNILAFTTQCVEAYHGTNKDGVKIFAVQWHPEFVSFREEHKRWFASWVEKYTGNYNDSYFR